MRALQKIRVQLDGLVGNEGDPTFFEAWTFGDRWNGWATPYFEKAMADAIIRAFNSRPGTVAYYDHAMDAYIFVDEDGEVEQYEASRIDGRMFYPIGTGSWCWSGEHDFD